MKILLTPETLEPLKLLSYEEAGKLLFLLLDRINERDHSPEDHGALVELTYKFLTLTNNTGILVK